MRRTPPSDEAAHDASCVDSVWAAGFSVMMISGLTAGTASAQTPEPGLPGRGAVEECGPPGTLIRQLVDGPEFPQTRFGDPNWGQVIQAQCAPGNLP